MPSSVTVHETPGTGSYTPGAQVDAPHVLVASSNAETDAVTALTVVNAILRHRRLLIIAPLLLSAAGATVRLVGKKTYTVVASFHLQTQGSIPSRFAGFAQQLGIGGAAADPGQSSLVAAKVVRLDEVLGPVIDTPIVLSSAADTRPRQVGELLGVDRSGGSKQVRERTIIALRDRLRTSVDGETQLVELRLTTAWPDVSAELVRRILTQLDQYYIERRRVSAEGEKAFEDAQLAAIAAKLANAENALESFRLRNRTYDGDPRLVIEHERLNRQIALLQTVYTNTAYQQEQARLDAARSTATIGIVQHPLEPVFPDRRFVFRTALLGAIVGVALVVFYAILRALTVSVVQASDEKAEFNRLLADARNDVRRMILLRPKPSR